jgi:hypothetical protein
MLAQGFADALGAGGADALVDRVCLPQLCGGLAGVAIVPAGLAESFQGARLLQRRADFPGDGQRLGVPLTGRPGGRSPGR